MDEAKRKRMDLLSQARELVQSAALLLVEPSPADPIIDGEVELATHACDEAVRFLDRAISRGK